LGIFNESIFHSLHSSSSSSSSEDSSSSSSYSSASSSVFLYSGLDYDVNDITSEEDDDGRRNTRNPSRVNYVPSDEEDRHMYVSDNDDDSSESESDIDNHPNYQESVNAHYIGFVGDMGSSHSDETTEDQYGLLCEDDRNNSESYLSRGNEPPRMSFLDPDLLNDVQNRRESIAIVESTSFNEENSSFHSSVDDDEILFIPAFARPHHFLFDDDVSRVE
jgi:hypothetical protein